MADQLEQWCFVDIWNVLSKLQTQISSVHIYVAEGKYQTCLIQSQPWMSKVPGLGYKYKSWFPFKIKA